MEDVVGPKTKSSSGLERRSWTGSLLKALNAEGGGPVGREKELTEEAGCMYGPVVPLRWVNPRLKKDMIYPPEYSKKRDEFREHRVVQINGGIKVST